MLRFLLLLTMIGAALASEEKSASVSRVTIAQFDDQDQLLLPEHMDHWVFLGSSLGMGYSQAEFKTNSPGQFQIVSMEPNAYKAFLETGKFVDGTMFALRFFEAKDDVSTNQAGFVMGDERMLEIHLKDAEKFPDGFNFYIYRGEQRTAAAIPLPNECVECHLRDGDYDSVFTQFYPTLRGAVPATEAHLKQTN